MLLQVCVGPERYLLISELTALNPLDPGPVWVSRPMFVLVNEKNVKTGARTAVLPVAPVGES